MKVIVGITGGIASGKSFVTNYLIEHGYHVIDADQISRESLYLNGPCYQAVIDAFSEEILLPNKEINRSMLAKIIFSNYQKRKVLNDIIHPYVKEQINLKVEALEDGLIFLDIPLLYEVELDNYCDKVIVVYVSQEIQIERLMARDNISLEYAKKKIDSQMSMDTKLTLADYVIDNSNSKEITIKSICKTLRKLEDKYALHI